MEGLYDERTAVGEELWDREYQGVDGVLADQREVRDGDVDSDIELAARDGFVGRDAKLTAAASPRLFNQRGYDVDPNDLWDSLYRECTHEPSLAAAEIQDGTGHPAHHCIDDSAVSDELATFDALLTNGRGPRGGVGVPRVDDLFVGQRIHAQS